MEVRSVIAYTVQVLLIVGVAQNAATASIITPIGASTSAPIAYTGLGSSLANVYDGVPNYGQWLALGQESGNSFAGPYTVRFNLDGAYNLTSFNLWNNGGNIPNDGEGVNSFALTFFNPSLASVGSFSGTATDVLTMQSFGLTTSNVETVDFTINSNHAPTSRPYVIFYEVNFNGQPTSVVPVPGAMLLTMIGLAGVGSIRSRLRNVL
jgi:hypothetical protein